MGDREWMFDGWASGGRVTKEWFANTQAFMDEAFSKVKGPLPIAWCPCSRCGNTRRQSKSEMGKHLCKFGFTKDYTKWTYHTETSRMRDEAVRQRIEEFDGDAGVVDMLDDYHEAHFEGERAEEEPEPSAKAYYDMLAAAKKALHDHTEVSQLDAIGRLMAVKSQYNLSRDTFDALVTVIGSMLPRGHLLPKNMYEARKVLRALKMPYEQIHACPKGCVLFRKEHENAKYCPKCKASRFVEVDSGDGEKRQLTIPVQIVRYLPPIPRIQRLYMSEDTAKQMTWHKTGIRYSDKLAHPSDAEAWSHFDRIHVDKANEARNVRVAIATDGFNPYGVTTASYSCWPVFVIPLNLPPGIIFQRQHIFLSLIIPGYPGDNMSVYMEPLIDDLLRAWEDGVQTYDRATKTNFKMHVWYMYSLHDMPAYGIFCGWCVHGKFPCPVCKAALKFNWLRRGGKYSSFDKHRQFLPLDHPFRRDTNNFTKDVVVRDHPPHIMTGAEVRAQLDTLVFDKKEGRFVGYGEQHAWAQKSGLWRLPYMQDLLLPHNIDMMHTEKNVAEALWGTIMDIPEKSKDNAKARADQEKLCNRPKLVIPIPADGKSWKRPKADFVLNRSQRKEVLEWFQNLMFPDGYAANLRRGVNLATLRINGLKSHDYHIWVERILPVMVRGYVPDHVWQVLAELSCFFRQLCAKELSRDVLAKLETNAPLLLCKLEKIFPPGFFNPMQHMILHLPHEARMGGPCRTVGAIQLRELKSSFVPKVRINAKLRLPLQRHTF